jgi:hypothetical protein
VVIRLPNRNRPVEGISPVCGASTTLSIFPSFPRPQGTDSEGARPTPLSTPIASRPWPWLLVVADWLAGFSFLTCGPGV